MRWGEVKGPDGSGKWVVRMGYHGVEAGWYRR